MRPVSFIGAFHYTGKIVEVEIFQERLVSAALEESRHDLFGKFTLPVYLERFSIGTPRDDMLKAFSFGCLEDFVELFRELHGAGW